MKKEKVYISRDEYDDKIVYVWRKPLKGNWSPTQMEGCESVCWVREDLNNVDMYLISDFKKKFKITILSKAKQCVHLSFNLLNKEDYKLFSDDPNRKK